MARFFAFAAMAAAALTSCSKDDDDDEVVPETVVKVESVTLSATTTEIKVGDVLTLTATLQPTGAKGDIVWASSDEKIATVAAGTVTGVAEGTAIITASVGDIAANCQVKVTKVDDGNNDQQQLSGSDFYVFQMDGATFDALGDKVKMDLRTDDVTKFLYVWDGTYEAGTTSGKNFFGIAESWISLKVTNVGWSGCGFCYGTEENPYDLSALYDIYQNPSDYYFHIAMKSTDNASHCIIFYGDGTEVKYGIGGAFVDNGVTYESLGSLTRDGEWNEIEAPMSKFVDKGLIYSENWKPSVGQNLLAFLSGGTTGTQLQIDAMYIYKK